MCARARVYVGVYMCVVEVHVCGYDKFTPRGLPISKTMIFIDKEKWNAGPNSAPTNESENFLVPRTIYQDWFFFTFSQSFKKSDLLENELPDVQSKVILQVCGAFWLFCMAECFELSGDSLSPTEESTSTRLISIGKHFHSLSLCLPFSLYPSPSPSSLWSCRSLEKERGRNMNKNWRHFS